MKKCDCCKKPIPLWMWKLYQVCDRCYKRIVSSKREYERV